MVAFFKESSLLKFGSQVFLFLAFFSVLTLVACSNGESDNGVVVPDQDSSSSVQDDLKVESSSSEWYEKGAFLNPDIEYGTFIDERDGKSYKTVVVGSRTWMAENLNYADSVASPVLVGRTDCIDARDEDCNVLGRSYSIQTMVITDSSSLKKKGGVRFYLDYQGICPDGWRVPSINDWFDLLRNTCGESMSCDRELFSKILYVASGSEYLRSDVEEYWKETSADSFGLSLPTMNLIYWINDPDVYYYHDSLWAHETLNGGDRITITGHPYGIFPTANIDYSGKYPLGLFDMAPATVFNGAVRCVRGGGVGEFSAREDLLNEKVKYDTLVDERDGRIYRTYKGIMAENLNFDDGQSLCYNHDKRNCELFGRLYNVKSIQQSDLDGPCPSGWRLLTDYDLEDFQQPKFYEDFFDAPKYRNTMLAKGWFLEEEQRDSVTDVYNFFPAGYLENGEFKDLGSTFAMLYKSVNMFLNHDSLVVFEHDSDSARVLCYSAKYDRDDFDLNDLSIASSSAFPVRCVEKASRLDLDALDTLSFRDWVEMHKKEK